MKTNLFIILAFTATAVFSISSAASEESLTDLEKQGVVVINNPKEPAPLYIKVPHPRDESRKINIELNRDATNNLFEMPAVLNEEVPEREIQGLATNIYNFADAVISSLFDRGCTLDEKEALRSKAQELERQACFGNFKTGGAACGASVCYVPSYICLVNNLSFCRQIHDHYKLGGLFVPVAACAAYGCYKCVSAKRASKLAPGATNLAKIRKLLEIFENRVSEILYDAEGSDIYLGKEDIQKRLQFIRDVLAHPSMQKLFEKFPKLDLSKANTFVPKRVTMK